MSTNKNMKSTLGVENNMKNSKKILAIGLTLFLVMVNTPMVNALTSVEQIKGMTDTRQQQKQQISKTTIQQY